MSAGKIIVLIGAVFSLLSLLLSLFLPEFFSWYSIRALGFGLTGEFYLTGFGTFIIKGAFTAPYEFTPTHEISVFELIGSIFIILGAILSIVGINKKSKGAGIIGGIWILLGPILFLIHILNNFAVIVEAFGLGTDVNVFWGGATISEVSISWNLWIGFFLAVGGGLFVLLGAAKLKSNNLKTKNSLLKG